MSEVPDDRVVDASLALKWVLLEDYTPEARNLLDLWQSEGRRPLAPTWFICEVANALHRRARAGALDLAAARLALRTILEGVVLQDMIPELAERAMEIAGSLGRPAIYDSLYAALAEREGCELWTADERFWNAARARFPWIRWIGERT